MASITLKNVTIDFPIYGAERSFRSALLKKTTGGLIRRDAGKSGKQNRVSVRALEDINLDLQHGDRLGLIGHNGAGKSTLLRVLAGVFLPTSGEITINGAVSPLFSTSPGLDMDATGYENIVTCGLFLGMTKAEVLEKMPEVERFSELGGYLSLPVRTYSSGMLVRLGFAIATAIDPEILILDEGLGAGDARFADRAKQRVDALIQRSSILVLASHSDQLIGAMCNKAALLESGRIICYGSVEEVSKEYAALQKRLMNDI